MYILRDNELKYGRSIKCNPNNDTIKTLKIYTFYAK